jgi:predicted ester cyclase
MRIGAVAVSLAGFVALAGCKKEEQPVVDTKVVQKAPDTPKTDPVAAPKAVTSEEVAKKYQDCWGHFNARNFDAFSACYAEDAVGEFVDSGMPPAKGRAQIVEHGPKVFATAFPDMKGELQLVLVNGRNIASIALVKGTHTGPFKTPMGEIPPTNKKVGFFVAHVVEMNEKGEAIRDWHFMDGATLMGQLGLNPQPHRPVVEKAAASPVIAIASDSQTERDNVAAWKADATKCSETHDAVGSHMSMVDDVVWFEAPYPMDLDKKGLIASLEEMFKGFPDIKGEFPTVWGAGDYTVAIGTIQGTNTGDMPSMKLKATGKPMKLTFIEFNHRPGGKVTKGWVFYDSMAMAGQLGLLEKPSK